jgi:hypothetical protein
VASTYLKATVIGRAVIDLLMRELVVARTVWTDAVSSAEWAGAFGDTVTIRVPARRTARTRVLRAGTPITNDDSNEFGVPVTLDTDVYNGANITDEQLTLDIVDFARQVLGPQVRAVAEGVEDAIAAQIVAATYEASHTIDADLFTSTSAHDWYKIANRARKILNDSDVPKSNRWMLVGSSVEEDILNNDKFIRFDSIGTSAEDALREASIGRIAGFTVMQSNSIPETDAYCYHRSAFVLATKAPAVPRGAAFAQGVTLGQGDQMGAQSGLSGINARWLMDYDYSNTTDRSLVDTYIGTAQVGDPEDVTDPDSDMALIRAVRISGGGTSS